MTRAAELPGVQPHTAYDVIERGELAVEVVMAAWAPSAGGGPVSSDCRRRLLVPARVKPGRLRHLHPR